MGHILSDVAAVLQVHALDARIEQGKGDMHRLTQIKGLALHANFARLQLRVVQYIVDHGHQVIRRLSRVVKDFQGLRLVFDAP